MSKQTLDRLQAIRTHFLSPNPLRLSGKVAIITGVGSLRGIGRATALLFAAQGARALYLLDYNEDGLQELKQEIESKFPNTKTAVIQADAADEKAIQSVIKQALDEHGQLDIFFANAGIVTASQLSNTDIEDFNETIRINTLSCFLAAKHASVAMQKLSSSKTSSSGSIIMTASVAGLRSGAGPPDYSASKAAVVSLANTCANQLRGTDIRVNAICPGLIETGMTAFTFDMAKERGTAHKIGQLNPMGRYGVAEEIAQAVLFLASDESSYVNGIALPVDGGLSSTHPIVPGRAF